MAMEQQQATPVPAPNSSDAADNIDITSPTTISTVADEEHKGMEIESTKAEMGEVMEENQRLKQYLDQIMKDYQALQMKFYEITQHDFNKPKNTKIGNPSQATSDEEDEAQLVSLSLGRSSSLDSKKSIDKLSININSSNKEKDESTNGSNMNNNNVEEMKERSLALGLNCKFEAPRTTSFDHEQVLVPTLSPDNSFDEMKNGEANDKESSSPNTMPKNNSIRSNGDDEVVQQPPVKKARVSVRARCDAPTMNDGCQWRKYGQKIAKGNPCPRAYYRCTVAPSCPVRKQVQRCVDDMSILITTYEGTHNHPLPISATAMASTTSAAAHMLTSGSSTSSQGSHFTTTPIIGNPNNSNPNQFYFSNLSSSTFSTIPTHPTITLDLTSTTSSSINHFIRENSSFGPKYPSTNLTFNNTHPINSWPYNKNNFSSMDIGNNNNSFSLQTLLPKNNLNNSLNQQPIPDTITQAAKVLTSDPSFQSVLSAALSSFISSNNNNNVGDFAQKIKWDGIQSSSSTINSNFQSSKGINGCGSSLMSMASSTTDSQQTGNLMFLSNSLQYQGSKSTSTSPSDNRDHAS